MSENMLSNRVSRRFLAAAALSLGMLGASSVLAHHSATMFDLSKTVELKGVVKTWLYTNPHCLLVMLAQNEKGANVEYSVEANGPGYLVRNGWKRDSLKEGDNVTVSMNPLLDGSPGGNMVEVTLRDGRKLSASPVRRPAPAPSATP